MKPSPKPPPTARPVREALFVWAGAAMLLIAAVAASRFVPLINQNLGFIAAVIFLLVPGYALRRRGEYEADYGLDFADWRRGLVWGVSVTLITLVVFVPAYHLWETRVEGHDVHFDAGNYRHPGQKWYGAPAHTDDGNVHVWTWGQEIFVAWTPQQAPWKLSVRTAGRGRLSDDPTGFAEGLGATRIVREGHDARPVRFRFEATSAKSLVFEAQEVGKQLAASQFRAGSASTAWPDSASKTATMPLGFGWIWTLVLTEFILVAIPEEFFFRGYVQTRFHQGWGRKAIRIAGLPLSWAIVATSVLFAVVHLFAVPDLTRLSVFFPALVFGALRERTGGITASVFYHACCNLMVLMLSVHYF